MKTALKISLILSYILKLTGLFLTIPSYGGAIWHSNETYNKVDTLKENIFINVSDFNLPIIPPSSGVQFYRLGIIFLSESKNYGKMLPDHVSFGITDAYYAEVSDSAITNSTVFSPLSQFDFPCEALTFTRDYNTMYFTRRGANDKTEKIYQANYSSGGKNSGKWTIDGKYLTFCNDNSIFTHPALSTDEKFMIFASNRPGSVGGMDLFITTLENGNWSEPKNLGEKINTKGNELYPFLDSKNNLYFSSDGLKGFGGYDIFVSRLIKGNWETPINLTNTINSENDDIAFTMNRTDETICFFTVRQKSGNKKMQLYRISRNEKNFKDNFGSLSDIFISKDFLGDILNETNPEVPQSILIANPSNPDSIKEIKTEVKKVESNTKTIITPETKIQLEVVQQNIQPPFKEDSIKSNAAIQSAKIIDIVVYRVQFLASVTPSNRTQITLAGKNFKTFEYFYNGAYRLCVGEFSSLGAASEFQKTIRKSGYPQAFVVAFKNNKRSTDPALFK